MQTKILIKEYKTVHICRGFSLYLRKEGGQSVIALEISRAYPQFNHIINVSELIYS